MKEKGIPIITVTEDTDSLDALLIKIFEEYHHDFREYKRTSIMRRIMKRLRENHLETYEEYMDLLDSNPEEYNKLIDTVLINVTEFFRDPEAWEALENVVIQKILSRKSKKEQIRIWSASCASGEEAYSIAILLVDKLGDALGDYDIKIYGTDIDENALKEARNGIFSLDRMKNVSQERVKKYFTREGKEYRIKSYIRHMISFGRHDLITNAPLPRIDLIICRNVLIYFTADLQSRLMKKFYYALNDNGHIFFGKSESMLQGSKLFQPVDKKWRIFSRIPEAIQATSPLFDE